MKNVLLLSAVIGLFAPVGWAQKSQPATQEPCVPNPQKPLSLNQRNIRSCYLMANTHIQNLRTHLNAAKSELKNINDHPEWDLSGYFGKGGEAWGFYEKAPSPASNETFKRFQEKLLAFNQAFFAFNQFIQGINQFEHTNDYTYLKIYAINGEVVKKEIPELSDIFACPNDHTCSRTLLFVSHFINLSREAYLDLIQMIYVGIPTGLDRDNRPTYQATNANRLHLDKLNTFYFTTALTNEVLVSGLMHDEEFDIDNKNAAKWVEVIQYMKDAHLAKLRGDDHSAFLQKVTDWKNKHPDLDENLDKRQFGGALSFWTQYEVTSSHGRVEFTGATHLKFIELYESYKRLLDLN